ncbi:hypothetical protein [Cuspidothrix issatschenkoi]|uniref:Uncharacterized protein n=1 Tax=Cuspidothrix issatschenkoi CHARLIE-1 TaxID=2052836 RepID=A0A2S6CSL8_9CYAN|nr:hypothetical protein [Cuspidothrix issatschenkoi]PPJ62753.1 hypothetical protein CUN59_13870 [Cuspidothrix issatschenkoi CHARLIE-1]
MDKIRAEIQELNLQIQALQQERAALTQNNMESSGDSTLAIVETYRRQARENVQLSAELKGIDDALCFLEKQIQQRKAHLNRYLPMSIRISQQQEQLEEARKIAQVHAERVNELAGELAKEIKLLKTCADELSPMYWQVYYKPFITGFKTISVPYVRSDCEVWTIVNRIV